MISPMQFIDEAEIIKVIHLPSLIEMMLSMYTGQILIECPPRVSVTCDNECSWLGLFWAIGPELGIAVTKFSTERRNLKSGSTFGDSAILLADIKSGQILATLAAENLTAARTAAATVAVVKMLNKINNVKQVAILGAGKQAWWHLLAINTLKQLEEIVIYGRNLEHVKQFVQNVKSKVDLPISMALSVEDAVKECQLVITATSSRKPLIQKIEWLEANVHLAAIGSHDEFAMELDSSIVEYAGKIIVDSLENAIKSGDLASSLKSGKIKQDDIATPQQMIKKGVGNFANKITIWKSVGNADQDLIATWQVWKFLSTK
jgi:ornithine cyclodeaminase/alanine dehydrogenase-like protein (mu-crystallin family)